MNKLLIEEQHKENMLGLRTFLTVFFESIHQQLTDELMNKPFFDDYLTEQKHALLENEESVRKAGYSLNWLFDPEAVIAETIDIYIEIAEKAANFQFAVAKLLEQHFPEKYPDYFFANGKLQVVVNELTTELEETKQTLKNTETTYKRLKTRHENTKIEFQEAKSALENQLSESHLELESLQEKYSELEEHLGNKIAQNEQLEMKITEKDTLIEKLEQSVSQLEYELKIAVYDKEEVLAKLEDLNYQIQSLNNTSELLSDELAHEERKVEYLNEQLEEKEKEIETQQILFDEIKIEKENLLEENQRAANRILEHEVANEEKEALIKFYDDQLNEKVMAYEEQIADLNNQLSMKEQQVTPIEHSGVTQEDYEYLEQQLEATREQLLSYMANAAESTNDHENIQLKERLDQLSDLYAKQKEYSLQIEEQVERLKEENLAFQNSQDLSSMDNLQKENSALQEEITQLKDALFEQEQLQKSLQEKTSTIQELERKIAKLEITNKNSHNYYFEAQKELVDLRTKNSHDNLNRLKMENDNRKLQVKVDNLIKEKAEFENKIQSFEKQINILNNTPQGQLYQELQRSYQNHHLREQEVEKLKNEKMSQKNTIFYKTKEIELLKNEIETLEEEIKVLKEKQGKNKFMNFW